MTHVHVHAATLRACQNTLPHDRSKASIMKSAFKIAQGACHVVFGPYGVMKRVAVFVVLSALFIAMSTAQPSIIELQVEAKKNKLLTYNFYASKNPDRLRDMVFCLCTACCVMAIMTRNDMINESTAWRHRIGDVEKGIVTEAELKAAVGTKTFISYEDYFHLYRQHLQGQLDEHGSPIDVQPESAADTCGAEAHPPPLADQSQGCLHAACPMEGRCPLAVHDRLQRAESTHIIKGLSI